MAAMNRLVALLFLAAVSAAPLATTIKCPNLTKLAQMQSCDRPIPNDTRNTTTITFMNLPVVLCLLYKDSFSKACELHDVDSKTWNETLALVTKSPEDLCGVLVGCPDKLNETQPWVRTIAEYINGKCDAICTGSDGKFVDECVKSAVLLKLIPNKNESVANTSKAELLAVPLNKLSPISTVVKGNLSTTGGEEVSSKVVESSIPSVVTVTAITSIKPPITESKVEKPVKTEASKVEKPLKTEASKVEKPLKTEASKVEKLLKTEASKVEKPLKTEALKETQPEEEEEEGLEDVSKESSTTPVAILPVKVVTQPPVIKDEVPPLPKLQNENEAYNDDDEYTEDIAKPSYNAPERIPEPKAKPLETDEDSIAPPIYANQPMAEDDSYFFSYFMMVCIVFILGYVGYHNKQKLLALVLEGRRGKKQQRRRPNSANYHKLDSNLEEAVTSACNKNTASVIY